MLESNLFDVLRIYESLEVDNLWIDGLGLPPGGQQEGCGAIRANRVTDNCFRRCYRCSSKLSKSRRLALMLGGPDLCERNRLPAAM